MLVKELPVPALCKSITAVLFLNNGILFKCLVLLATGRWRKVTKLLGE